MKPLLSLGAIDVLRPFHVACSEHGVPDVLAIDRGNENCLLQQVMWVHFWGELHDDPLASRTPPVLFSRSVVHVECVSIQLERL